MSVQIITDPIVTDPSGSVQLLIILYMVHHNIRLTATAFAIATMFTIDPFSLYVN